MLVGICAILKDEARYIEEWLAFHIIQGFSHIVLYNNGSTDETAHIAKDFSAYASVTVTDWPATGESFDETQKAAYEDGAKRLTGLVDFVAFIDIDEFLYSADKRPITLSLQRFDCAVSAIAVTQTLFGSSWHISYKPDLVISRFIRTSKLNNSESHWFKTIARPGKVVQFDSVHSVQISSGDYVLCDGKHFICPFSHPGFSNRSTKGILRLNHYMLKSREEFLWKRRRWADSDSQNRYSESYFRDRDTYANEEYNADLRVFRRRVLSLINEVCSPESYVRRTFPRGSSVLPRNLSRLLRYLFR